MDAAPGGRTPDTEDQQQALRIRKLQRAAEEAKDALHKQQLTETEALALAHGKRAAQLERELQSQAKRCRELETVVAQMKGVQQDHLAQIGRMQGAQVGFERRGFELEAARSRIAELEGSLRESTAVAERRRLELEDIRSSLQLREKELQAAQQDRSLATQVLAASQLREQESCRQLAQLQQQVEASSRSSAEIEGVLRAAQAREARLAKLEGTISAATSASPSPRPAQVHVPRLSKDESTPALLECGGRSGGLMAAAWSPAPSVLPLHSEISSPEISQLQPQAPSEGGGSSAPASPSPSPPPPRPRRPSATHNHSAPQLPAQPRPRQCQSPHVHNKGPGAGFDSGGGFWEAEGLNALIGGVGLALQRVSTNARSLSPMPRAA